MQTQSNLKAGLWMAAWLMLMLGMTVAGREATREIGVLQLMELRSVIGFVMLLAAGVRRRAGFRRCAPNGRCSISAATSCTIPARRCGFMR